jgi:hypothetical protein
MKFTSNELHGKKMKSEQAVLPNPCLEEEEEEEEDVQELLGQVYL